MYFKKALSSVKKVFVLGKRFVAGKMYPESLAKLLQMHLKH